MNPRFRLKERAKKFGRYCSFRAACSTRSLVCFGIALAAGESLTTTETVAGESFKYSASDRRLTGFAGRADFDEWVTCALAIVLESTFQLSAVPPRWPVETAAGASPPQVHRITRATDNPIKAVL